MLKVDFPLRISYSEAMTAQVGLLQLHRSIFYAEVATGNYMKTFHLIRHSVLDYRSQNFVRRHFFDRAHRTTEDNDE